MSTSVAAMQGQDELKQIRLELEKAEDAIVMKLTNTALPSGQLVKDVAATEDLDLTTVQRALWHLVHEGVVEFVNGYDIRKT